MEYIDTRSRDFESKIRERMRRLEQNGIALMIQKMFLRREETSYLYLPPPALCLPLPLLPFELSEASQATH